MSHYDEFLSDSRTPIDVNGDNVMELIYPEITLLYNLNTKTLTSRPTLSRELQGLIIKVIDDTITNLKSPLPHLELSLRTIYTNSKVHSYPPPDIATAYLAQQVLQCMHYSNDNNDIEQQLEAILNVLIPGTSISNSNSSSNIPKNTKSNNSRSNNSRSNSSNNVTNPNNPINPYLDTINDNNLHQMLYKFKIQPYPLPLIDMYYEIDSLLNEFEWDNPNASLYGQVGTIPAYNDEQASTQSSWLH